MADGKTLSAREFRDRLEGRGVAVHANLAKTGRMNGFSYQIDGLYFKSSALGKKYSYQSLKNRGVTFDQADRNAFSKNHHTGEHEHELGDITTIPTIRENSVLDMHIFGTTKILDSGQERAGDAAVLRQNEITHPLVQPTQTGGVQHLGIKVKQSPETVANPEDRKSLVAPSSAYYEKKAVRPPQAAPAPAAAGRPPDPTKAPSPSPTKAELSDSDARKAKAAFSHIIASLQHRQPGHKELRLSLPNLLLVHADRIVKMKDYAKQQQATKELFKSDDGIKIANMILNNNKRKDISK